MSQETTKREAKRLEPVRRATTREELEAVYRFRYEVYFEEFGRELGSPDHDRRWVTDDDDELPFTTILYTGTPEHVTGTVRLRHWRAGEVPHHDFEELSMDRFQGVEGLHVAEIGRLMVRPSARGKLALASLLRESYRLLAGEHETDLCFCYCSPGLVRYYQKLAMRPFGGRPVHAPDGIMLPLVAVMSDHDYYRSSGSLLASLVPRYFGPGKRQPLDLEPHRHLFAPGTTGIDFEPERVWRTVEEMLCGRPDGRPSVLGNLCRESARELVKRGLVVDVEPGTLMTRKGFVEREVYLILEGTFEATDDGRFLARMGTGDVFGEIALLHPDGRRTATVSATTPGRVLMLRGNTVMKFARRHPELATPLMRHLEEAAASRLTLDLEAA